MKKGVYLVAVIMLLILSSNVIAGEFETESLVPDGISWIGGSSFYEFSESTVEIRLNTPSSNIIQANFSLQGVSIDEILNPDPADCSIIGNTIVCNTDFDILTLEVTPDEVDADRPYTWTVSALDSVSGLVTKDLTFTTLNDANAPTITLITPTDMSIVKNVTTLFNASIVELESGLSTKQMYYDYYNTIATSDITTNNNLDCVGDYCTTSVSLNPTGGRYYLGFFFNASDEASNVETTDYYYLYIDTTVPGLTLDGPAYLSRTNSDSIDFDFTASDNSFESVDEGFKPELDCELFVDSNSEDSIALDSNSSDTLTADISGLEDGSYQWYITCTDSAGWYTTSETRTFIKDTTGPTITSNTTDLTILASGKLIEITVTDDSGTASINYTLNGGAVTAIASPYNIDTATFSYGENTVTITAEDSLGNPSSETFTYYLDNQGPTITLNSPADGAYGNGIFTAIATDDYSSTLECSIYVESGFMAATSIPDQTLTGVVNDTEMTFNVSLSEGNMHWYVRCADELGNSNPSETRNLIVDTIAPLVTLVSPTDYGRNFESGDFNPTVEDNYTVTEVNGYGCTVYVNGYGDPIVPSNDPYEWYVECEDEAGNIGTSETWHFYYDNLYPIITNLNHSSIDSGSATITWTVNEYTENTVYYSTDKDFLLANMTDASSASASDGTSPSAALSSLSESTQYYYIVVSCDQFNQCTDSSDSIDSSTFTTSAAPASPSGGGGGGGGSSSRCGNGYCQPTYNENCETCPLDCGYCGRNLNSGILTTEVNEEEEENGENNQDSGVLTQGNDNTITSNNTGNITEETPENVAVGSAWDLFANLLKKPFTIFGIIAAIIIILLLSLGWGKPKKKDFLREFGN